MSGATRLAQRLGIEPVALLGLAVIAGGLLIWILTFTSAIPKLFESSTHPITARVANVEALGAGDPVRVDGVQVGQVGDTELDPGGRTATVTLDLDGGAPTVYRNATVAIRWRTVLGGADAVSLDPGTPSAGPLGRATLPLAQTSSQIELDEITRVVHAGAKAGLRAMIQQLGPAFADPRAPADAFRTLSTVAPGIASGMDALRGLQPDTDLQNLVREAGAAAQALSVGPSADVTRQFIAAAGTTLATTAQSAGAIEATLNSGEVVLPQLTDVGGHLDRSLSMLGGLESKLMPAAPAVAPALQALHPAVSDADDLLHRAVPLLDALRPAADSLGQTSRIGAVVVEGLEPSLDRLASEILPALDRVSPESRHTVYEMIGPTFAGIDSLGGTFDRDGFVVHLDGSGSSNVLDGTLPCRLEFGSSTTQFLTCTSILGYLQQLFTPNANLMSPVLTQLHAEDPRLAQRLLKGIPGLGGGSTP